MDRKRSAAISILVAATLAVLLAACDAVAGGAVPAKTAKLTMLVESVSAKTILPSFAAPASYKLTVSAGPTAIGPLTSETGTFSLELLYGGYDFLVEGFDGAGATGKLICSGSLTGKSVDADDSITVSVAPAYSAGSGEAKITVFWPTQISASKAEFALVPVNSDPVAGDFAEFQIAGHRASFTRASIAAGDYVLYYRLWKGATRLVSESRAVQIASNLRSSALIGLSTRHFETVAKLTSNSATSALVLPDGKLWTWGSDEYPLRGIPASATVNPFPSQMAGNDWSMVDYGFQNAAGIKADGSLWSWGEQALGRTGTAYIPGQVGSDTDWVMAAVGFSHLVGIKNDGSLWACGSNTNGELGLGDTTVRANMTRVGTESDWVQVVAGTQDTIALKADGTRWSWGSDSGEALGNGSGESYSLLSPTQMGYDSDWASIFSGSTSSLGLKTDGTLYGWGSNESYQLGLMNNVNKGVPTKVGSDTTWTYLAISYSNSVGLKSDGSLWAWGAGITGATGQGDTMERIIPTRVGTDTDWVDAAVGRYFAMARKADGRVFVWGYNTKGQLGNGLYAETISWMVPALNSLSSFPLGFDLKGATGTVPASRSLRYNETTSAPDMAGISMVGHEFAGWYSDSACTATWDFATSRVLGATTLYARWVLEGFNAGLSVLLESPAEESISLGADQSLSRAGTLTVNIAEDFDAYRWYLDGERIAGATAKPLSLPMSGYTLGRHNLTASVSKGGRWYSKTLYLVLTE